MDMIRVIENGKKKRGESHDDDSDRISKLPHEILISIISILTLREAIATRILSTRWRYLCTNEYATHLNFPSFNLGDASLENILIRRRFRNYINMINQIVDSHKGPKVKEFRMQMHCLEGATIEKWLVFALSKKVEIIDIHMKYLKNSRRRVAYSFQLRNLIMQLPLGLRSLKKLSLSSIVVEDSEIELLLSNSPQLESLSIALPRKLTKVAVVGHGQPTFMLKHLEICHAVNLKLVLICYMPNLVSLKLHKLAPTFALALDDVPKLVEFSTSDDDYGWILYIVFAGVAPSICSQLHTLKICSSPSVGTYPIMVQLLPVFKSVKHLELKHAPFSVLNDGFWQFLRVIQTCPSLEELEIKLLCPVYTNFQEKEYAKNARAPFPKGELFPSLKKMKFSGFLGNSAELMVVISILNNANSLEELIVEVCDVTEGIRLRATARASEHIQPTVQDSTRLQVI